MKGALASFSFSPSLHYRCEVNHQLLASLPIEAIIDKARYNFSGDSTVIVQIRRLEVSLRPDGWRGNAEIDIQLEEEMLAQRLTSRDRGEGDGDDVSLLGFTDSMAGPKKKHQPDVSILTRSVVTDDRSISESKS
jgi:hypothetical protein